MLPGGEVKGAIVVNVVEEGIGSCHDGTVGGQGEWDRTVDVGKTDPFLSQRVQVRSFSPGVPVASDAVGPGGIESDQQHIQFGVALNLVSSRCFIAQENNGG